MTYMGKVQGGVVVVEGNVKLPDGATVRIDVLENRHEEQGSRSLLDRLASVVGKAKGLPADAANNVDRDLYGDTRS